ncbi:3-oxo-5-alpha-steroid 4-dehydrogenase, partial [Opisthorchis viverrini]
MPFGISFGSFSVTLLSSSVTFLVPHPTVLCALTLLLTHLVRRLYESKCISVYGRSRMSFTHLILGISFYLVVPAAIYASRTSACKCSNICSHCCFFLFDVPIYVVRTQPVADQYFEPRGRMFKHIVCPHFLFEMAMYLSLHLLLCTSWIPFSHMVIFVLVNQSCSAWLSYHWYLERFPKWTSN